ncbi:hypothetical protein C2S52_001647 [Perilla frutescens var. hirtella]|nr:hypothetical protein C2S52_001647 [Perilla frutescens var. hirtella]
MLILTNQPTTSRSQVEPEPEDVRNWIIPVIPLDCTDSPVVRNLDHVIDKPLRKGSVFYTKEDLYVAIGLWHMECKAEFKVPHSCRSRVENVRAKAVAAYYAHKMRHEENIMKPREIMAELLHEFGIQASYQVALRSYGLGIVELFQIAANTYRPKVYEKVIEAIGKSSPGAWNKLMTTKPECWARSQCPISRFSFPTSNIAESFNSRLLFARRLPIVSTIEAIRHVMEKWFDQRRAVSRTRDDDLTEEAHNKLAPQVDKGDHFKVVARSQMTFKVSNKESYWIVGLNSRTCECREFQDDLMPCSHASAAIR